MPGTNSARTFRNNEEMNSRLHTAFQIHPFVVGTAVVPPIYFRSSRREHERQRIENGGKTCSVSRGSEVQKNAENEVFDIASIKL